MTEPFFYSHKDEMNSNVIIQDEEIEDLTNTQPLFGDNSQEYEDNYGGKWGQQIKINKQKLLKYVPLTQKNINTSQLSTKVKQHKGKDKSDSMQTTQLYPSTSVKTFKHVKHKLTTSNIRLKTYADKENCYKPCGGKNSTKNSQTSSLFNKTTSLMTLKDNGGFRDSLNVKDERSGYKMNQNSFAQMKGNSSRHSNSKFKVSTTKSKDMNRAQSKTPSRYGIQNTEDLSVDQRQIINALAFINDKQQQLGNEKKMLQDRVKELRQNVEREHLQMQEISRNKQKMNNWMTRQDQLSRYCNDETRIYKRKLETCMNQAKTIQIQLKEINQGNIKLNDAINQERELIGMYQSVIDQIKGQLKIEKQGKMQLQKKVAVLKKNSKTVETKSNTQKSNTRQMFQKIFVSLGRWQ